MSQRTGNGRDTLDNYDLAIISALSADAGLSTIELSRRVHLSRTAVSRRLQNLLDRGVLSPARYDVNFGKLGYAIRAYVSVSTPVDVDSFRVLDQLLERPEVLDVSVVLGDELLVAEVIATDTDHLHQFLTWVHDIGVSETKVVLKKHRSAMSIRTRKRLIDETRAHPDPRLRAGSD